MQRVALHALGQGNLEAFARPGGDGDALRYEGPGRGGRAGRVAAVELPLVGQRRVSGGGDGEARALALAPIASLTSRFAPCG